MKVLDDGSRSQVYMVMEWVDGRLLQNIIHELKKLPPDRARRIAINVLHALDHIQSRSVAHRDLKPENVMVDDQDRIKLIDFGIAVLR